LSNVEEVQALVDANRIAAVFFGESAESEEFKTFE